MLSLHALFLFFGTHDVCVLLRLCCARSCRAEFVSTPALQWFLRREVVRGQENSARVEEQRVAMLGIHALRSMQG